MKNKQYLEYELLQKRTYCSLESDNTLWKMGQKRFIDIVFKNTEKNVKILDIACGDGVGLSVFKSKGFTNVVGVEFNKTKYIRAKKIGFPVFNYDMHNLSKFSKNSFEIIYSSHTLEHSFDVKKVVTEFYRILNDNGMLVLVLPYPDLHRFNIQAHVAKGVLGTNVNDKGRSIVAFFKQYGFKLMYRKFDYFREPEIWLLFSK